MGVEKLEANLRARPQKQFSNEEEKERGLEGLEGETEETDRCQCAVVRVMSQLASWLPRCAEQSGKGRVLSGPEHVYLPSPANPLPSPVCLTNSGYL